MIRPLSPWTYKCADYERGETKRGKLFLYAPSPAVSATYFALMALRRRIVFADDTANLGTVRHIPSAGHCAVVATLVQHAFGGAYISAIVEGQSHWYNRIEVGDRPFDVDLTGDQFGREPVRIVPGGTAFVGARVRRADELNTETLNRAAVLRSRLK